MGNAYKLLRTEYDIRSIKANPYDFSKCPNPNRVRLTSINHHAKVLKRNKDNQCIGSDDSGIKYFGND